MKTLRFLALFILAITLAGNAFAQVSGGRAASGEKRAVDTKTDENTYEVMKTKVSKELNEVVSETDKKIEEFNGNIELIQITLNDIDKLLDDIEGSLGPENDSKVAAAALADSRNSGGAGPVVCNQQTEDLYFDKSTKQWVCTPSANGCMASQNVWQ